MTDYVVVDVFTDTPLAGNPLAVIPDARALGEDRLQAIAREFNLSETAFVFPAAHASHDARVRIFTPAEELPFAGHPNVGTAFALAHAGAVLGRPVGERLRFEEGAGVVLADLLREEGVVVGASVRAPLGLALGPERPAAAVAALARLPASAILARTHPPRYASVGTGFLLAETTRDALEQATPDPEAFRGEAAHAPGGHLPALYLWADMGRQGAVAQVEARMFAPLAGVIEDPATGSAAAALGALLAAAGVADRLSVRQGRLMNRPSTIDIAARSDGIWISGRCAMVAQGRLLA
ncbi:MAG: PhzF family phenazine biosynthesis protein [Sphingomonadaceae bacterium]